MLSLVIALAAYSFNIHRQQARLLRALHEGYLPLALDLGDARAEQVVLRSYLERLIQSGEKPIDKPGSWYARMHIERKAALERALHDMDRAQGLERLASASDTLGEARDHLKKILATIENFNSENLSLSQATGDDLATLAARERKLESELHLVWNINHMSSLRTSAQVQQHNKRIAWSYAGLAAIIVAIGGYLSWRVRRLLLPLPMLQKRVEEIARGQFSHEPLVTSGNELTELAQEFERMVEALSKRDARLDEARQIQVRLQHFQREILSSLDIGVMVVDSDNVLQLANPRALKWLGLTNEHVGRESLAVLLETPIWRQIEQAIARAAEANESAIQDTPLYEFHQRKFKMSVTSLSAPRDNQFVTAWLVLIDDVTSDIHTRAKLLHSERLAAMGRMAAHITHEIRNPLSSIALNIELLEDQLRDSGMNPSELVNAMRKEINRLRQITEEYLRVVRLPAPQLYSDDMGELARSVIEFVKPDMLAQGANVDLHVASNLPMVPFDEPQMRQALLNLLRNAQEAMPEGGRIVVSVELEGQGVTLRVRDEGVGVTDEERERIFELFYTTKERGSGLGLALTKQIVEAHGGTIRCLPSPGKGTIFEIWIPLSQIPRTATTQQVQRELS